MLRITIVIILLFLTASASAEMPPDLRRMEVSGIIYHFPARFQPAVDTMTADLDTELPRLEAQLGISLAPVDVWVVKRIGDFYAWHDEPNRAPEWAVGLSLSNRRTVLVVNGAGPNGEPVDLVKTLRHELAHVGIDIASGAQRAPRWFHEGFALIHAEEWSPERSVLLSRAGSTGTLRSFGELSATFPPHRQSAGVAYAQSYHFVRHLGDRFGDDIFGRVLADMRRGKEFETAFKHQTGFSRAVVEAAWRTDLEDGLSPMAILSDEMLLFFGASLLFLVAFGVRRYRASKKLASMELDEAGDGWSYDDSRYPLPGEK